VNRVELMTWLPGGVIDRIICCAEALTIPRCDDNKHIVVLLHDVVDNPFRPISIDPAWLRWHDGLLVSMAQKMYDSRDFGDRPVLADAIEEAGCSDQDILSHCRQPSEHVRGCWLVDRWDYRTALGITSRGLDSCMSLTLGFLIVRVVPTWARQ
jgi:hypothetical protein